VATPFRTLFAAERRPRRVRTHTDRCAALSTTASTLSMATSMIEVVQKKFATADGRPRRCGRRRDDRNIRRTRFSAPASLARAHIHRSFGMADACLRRRVRAVTGANVLVIDGIGENSVSHALARLAAQSSLRGTTVSVFDRLADLPRYSAIFDERRTPEVVVALRTRVSSADAALIVTDYHGPIASMVHNAIDWITRQWNDGALHDKPLAVLGHAGGCYSGVWSHRQTGDGPAMAGPVLVEPLTVATLREAVRVLACEAVRGGEASGRCWHSSGAAAERQNRARRS
jgi:hypothetical protein